MAIELDAFEIERRDKASGVALWRQIADRLRLDIAAGQFAEGDKLPGEVALSERFGVNRHTVRSALASLQAEGAIRSEQGRGSFVLKARRLSYAIAERTRFSTGLAGQVHRIQSVLLEHSAEPAGPQQAAALGLTAGTPLIRLESVSTADGQPISRATTWLPGERFGGIEIGFERTGSLTKALKRFGISDYRRVQTTISARYADADETQGLRLAPGAIILVSEGIDAEADGARIIFVRSRFAADRVDMVVRT